MARTDAQVDRDAGVNRQSTPTVDASDAAEKARIAAMRKANAKSRPATFLEQVEGAISKTQASISNLENTQAELDANPNAIPKAGTFMVMTIKEIHRQQVPYDARLLQMVKVDRRLIFNQLKKILITCQALVVAVILVVILVVTLVVILAEQQHIQHQMERYSQTLLLTTLILQI